MRFQINGSVKALRPMIDRVNILVVIPTYNHPQRLREVVQGALSVTEDVLVVDDGSDQPASELLEGLDVEVVRHEVNHGKGAAISTAGDWAARRDKTHIITIDADGQHDPAEIPKFIKAIQANPHALIIGVRNFAGSHAPFSSRFGRAFGNFWVRVQTGKSVGDIQSGFRAYPVNVLQAIDLWFCRYAFEVEIAVRAFWASVPLVKIDVTVEYPPREQRVSHFSGLRDNLHLFALNTHLTMRSIVPWPHRRLIAETGDYQKVTYGQYRNWLTELIKDGGTPHGLAMAAMLGIILGALPIIGLHTLVIILAARMLKLNKVLAVMASHVCMPPFVPALSIEAGYLLRNGKLLTLAQSDVLTDASLIDLGKIGAMGLFDWLIGSLIVGPILAVIAGLIVFLGARSIRRVISG